MPTGTIRQERSRELRAIYVPIFFIKQTFVFIALNDSARKFFPALPLHRRSTCQYLVGKSLIDAEGFGSFFIQTGVFGNGKEEFQ
jgi:hypothetical protein